MSVSQEWAKVIRDVQGVFLAVRASLRFTWAGKSRRKSISRTVRIATAQSAIISDSRVLAELEHRKNLAYLNNARNMVR